MDMTEFFDLFLEKYNILEKAADKKWDRMEKYEAEGDMTRAQRASARMDELNAQQKGMEDVLEMIGYTLIRQNGEYKIVEYK